MSYTIQRKQLQNPLSASYSDTASYVNPLRQDVIITGSIILTGSANISKVDYIDFLITGSETYPAHQEGRLHWYDDGKTLQLDTDVNGFMIEIGHQNVVRVRNNNTFQLNPGTVVYINGSHGAGRPTVATASWEGDPTSASTLGLVAQTIGTSGTGYVVTNGLLRKVNTTGLADGAQLYLSSSGKYTNVPPDAPKHEVRLGKVLRGNSANEGIIYIDVMNGYELDELHDLKTTTATNGDLLMYSSSLWTNSKQLTGSYGLTGSLSFRNGGVTGSLFGTASWARNSITASAVSVSSTNTSNTYYLHFGNLTSGTDNIEVDTNLTYNPSTNELTAATFIGDLSGNATSANAAGFASSAGNSDNVTVNAFDTVDNNTTHYFILENGVEGASSSETLYEHLLLSYLKQNNSYLFGDTEDKVAPKITIGAVDSSDKADVFVYGNVIATGIISAPNLSTGLNTLNFVSDYTRPEETIEASLSVNNNVLTLSSASFATSLLTLTPIHPLPNAPATGTFAVSSSSPPKPYFYNGTSWNPLY
jgi:hypothetical protein